MTEGPSLLVTVQGAVAFCKLGAGAFEEEGTSGMAGAEGDALAGGGFGGCFGIPAFFAVVTGIACVAPDTFGGG